MTGERKDGSAETEKFEYADILFSAPPKSPVHPPMSREDRAAQFAPFAAMPIPGEKKEKAGEDREPAGD